MAEYDSWIAQTGYNAAFNLQAIQEALLNGPEYASRTHSVDQIKAAVRDFLNHYYAMTAEEKLTAQDRLGIRGEAADLSREELDKIILWINSRGLHFGQSAYLALEAMLDDAEISYAREALATDLILMDILTGILSPFESGDLVLSLYALKKKAARYGLELVTASLDYDGLLALAKDANGNLTKRVVAHVNKDHYVIITKVTAQEVIYIDPGMGADHQNQVMTAARGEFIALWDGAVMLAKPVYDFLQAMPQPPPAARVLTAEESMHIRGAFFGAIFNFLKNIFVGAFNLVVDLITLSYHQIINFFTFQFDDLFHDTKTDLQQIVTDLRVIADVSVHFIADTLAIVPFIGKPVSRFFKKVATFIIDGAEVTFRATIQALPDNLQEAVKFIQDPLGSIAQVAGAGMQAGFAYTLTGLGVSKEKAEKIAGIAVGAVKMVAGAVLFGVTGNTTVLAQGFYQLSTELGLSPAIASAISIAGSALIGGAMDGKPETTIFQALKNAAPKIAASFAQAGMIALGDVIGLDPRLAALISVPVSASIGAITGNIVNGSSTSIFNSIKNLLLNSQTLGGLVSVGASIGLDAMGAPPILQGVVPNFLGSLVSGIGGSASSGGGGPPDPATSGDNLFKHLIDTIVKFGKGVVSTVGNVLSFGAKVLESGANLVKQGFAKAVDFFSGIFSRQTQEAFYQIGGGSIENAILNNTTIDGGVSRSKVIFGGVEYEIVWDETTKALTAREGGRTLTTINPGLLETGQFVGNITMGEKISDKLSANYIFNDGVFKEAQYIDIPAAQILSRIRESEPNKGIEIDASKGFRGIFENFFTGTAYVYEAGKLIAQSALRKDSQGLFSLTTSMDLLDQVKVAYDVGSVAFEGLYKSQTALYDQYLKTIDGYRDFIQEALSINPPRTDVYNDANSSLNAGVVAVDKHLNWLNFFSLQTRGLAMTDLLFLMRTANRRWAQATIDAAPHLVEAVQQKDASGNKVNKFIFVPGINSEVGTDVTFDQINTIAGKFQNMVPGKQVVYCHSAGTETCLKSIEAGAKADFYVFASPRVSRDEFSRIIKASGLRPEQVLVVSAEGDYPHWPTNFLSDPQALATRLGTGDLVGFAREFDSQFDSIKQDLYNSFYDYEKQNPNDKIYTYAFIKSGPLVGFDSLGLPTPDAHGVPYRGLLRNDPYIFTIDGVVIPAEELEKLYQQVLEKDNR